jgi:hypothetical protein
VTRRKSTARLDQNIIESNAPIAPTTSRMIPNRGYDHEKYRRLVRKRGIKR